MFNSTDKDSILLYVEQSLTRTRVAVDTHWVMTNSSNVFFSVIAMTLTEIGYSRHKNSVFIMVKNLLVLCLCSISWWLWGAAFATGVSINDSIGTTKFVENTMSTYTDYNQWVNGFTLCLLSTLIAVGSFTERGNFASHILFTSIYSGLVFPLCYHWAWNESGWLRNMGYYDMSGAGVVNISGAAAGLGALIVTKSRKNKNSFLKKETEFNQSSRVFIGIGGLLYYFVYLSFNQQFKATTTTSYDYSAKIGSVTLNSIIGSAASGITVFLIRFIDAKIYDYRAAFNGTIAGLIAISAGGNTYISWPALIIGISAGITFFVYFFIIEKHIKALDDHRLSFTLHYSSGSLGIILVGFFHRTEGLFYAAGGKLLGLQFLGFVIFTSFPFACGVFTFLFFKLIGWLDIDSKTDEQGLDKTKLQSMSYVIDSESSEIYFNCLTAKSN